MRASTRVDASDTIYFDFQTDSPTRFIPGASQAMPFPDLTVRRTANDFALMEFVVNADGEPQLSTLKLLSAPTELDIEIVRASIASWRYSPAMKAGRAVRQLVQTPLRWK